jgi:hypothetical protein
VQFGSVFFRIVIAVIVVVQISVLLGAVGPFCEAAVRITIFLEEVRIGTLSDRSSSSGSSDQYSFGGSWSILQSNSSDQYSFGGSSDQYSLGGR